MEINVTPKTGKDKATGRSVGNSGNDSGHRSRRKSEKSETSPLVLIKGKRYVIPFPTARVPKPRDQVIKKPQCAKVGGKFNFYSS